MRSKGLKTLVVVSLGATAACSAAEAGPDSNTVRDSTGIRIVESAAPGRYAAPWILDSIPSWSVGQLDGDPEYLLDRVAGAMQLPDGTVLVANGGSNELRFYSADGTFLRSEGREGQGPGEFEYIRGLGRCRSGGFVAFDLNWQMNAYTLSGDFIEKTVFRAPSGVTPYELACDTHGHVVLIGWGQAASDGPPVGFYPARDRLLLTNHDGDIEEDYGEHLVSERIGSRFGSRPHPAGRATLFALHQDELFLGSGETFEVQIRTLADSLVSLLRGPRLDLEITDELKARYLQEQLSRVADDRRADLRREIEGWEWPPTFPAFVDLRIDVEGIVWLRAFSPLRDAPPVWSLFDASTGYLGDLELPVGHELLSIGSDFLLLLTTDDLDVQTVIRLALNRRNEA